ncbi:carbohydrate sulfotransferase 12 [Ambystoma mexicanum]|uniref:carbohydrate sulfotransferase 12 n=1 Tax=Ambystoma mexicanum TaxID=8296 RepID=UPI0037E98CB7
MTKSRMFRLSLVLGSIFMIIFIIVFWDNGGTTQSYLHTSYTRPVSPQKTEKPPATIRNEETAYMADVDEFLDMFLNSSMTKTNNVNERTAQTLPLGSSRAIVASLEENVRGYDWTSQDNKEPLDEEMQQAARKETLRHFCANSSFSFATKHRTFDDIPNKELDHLIVDDRHGIIYCYVPKVACTNWKRVMIVLSQSLTERGHGIPYRDPLQIPREDVHNSSTHLTFNKFWRRYGKFSRHLMKIKLKKYTKFLFVRDPFVRLISAFRSKFLLENEEFYRSFAVPILKLFSNHTDFPATVSEAFSSGMIPSFNQFIQYLLDSQTEKEKPFNEHWRQVYRLCHPCQIEYDFIGKLETLNEDAAQLLRLLDVDTRLQFPPSYRNRTASSWEEDWFAKIPVAWRQQLYKLYEADFVLFGYPKPENLLED